jgi:hypothetical protein
MNCQRLKTKHKTYKNRHLTKISKTGYLFLKCIHIGLFCAQEDAADRPTMSSVVHLLGSDTVALQKLTQPAFSIGRMFKKGDQTSKNSKDNSVDKLTLTIVSPDQLKLKQEIRKQNKHCFSVFRG